MAKTFKKLVIKKKTTDIREAVAIIEVDMCLPQTGEVCIKNKYVGINADDVNFAKGRFFLSELPCDIGFEGLGEVVAVGSAVHSMQVGDKVAYFTSKCNSYAEYSCVPATHVFQVPELKPEYLVLILCGLTASIGLDKAGRIKENETVLVTAAAGGVGHIAVQWAKLTGCHVIGTCSTKEKEVLLKELDCDRVINYERENIEDVLAKEYPRGLDVVWETCGGKVFETCLKHLATRGRLIVAGGISGYKNDSIEAIPRLEMLNIPDLILFRSRSLVGFNMDIYSGYFFSYFPRLQNSLDSGKLKVVFNTGCNGLALKGLESIADAVEYLHSANSIGKLLVKIY